MSFNDIAKKPIYKQQTLFERKRYTRSKNLYKYDVTVTIPVGWNSPIACVRVPHLDLVREEKSSRTFGDLRVYDLDNAFEPIPFFVDGSYYNHCLVFVRLPVTSGTRNIRLEFGNTILNRADYLGNTIPALDPRRRDTRAWIRATEPSFAHRHYPFQDKQNYFQQGQTVQNATYLDNHFRDGSLFASPAGLGFTPPRWGQASQTSQPYFNYSSLQASADYLRGLAGPAIEFELSRMEIYVVERVQGQRNFNTPVGGGTSARQFRIFYNQVGNLTAGFAGGGDVPTYTVPAPKRGIKRLITYVYESQTVTDFISNRQQLRVNGVNVSDSALPAFFDDTPVLGLGYNAQSGTQHFDGQIYDMILRQDWNFTQVFDRRDIEKMLLAKHEIGSVPTHSALTLESITDNSVSVYLDNFVREVNIDNRSNNDVFEQKRSLSRINIDTAIERVIVAGNRFEDWDTSDEVVRINNKECRELEVNSTGVSDEVTIYKEKDGQNYNDLDRFRFTNPIRSEDFKDINKYITFLFEAEAPEDIDLGNSYIEFVGSNTENIAFEDFTTGLSEGVNTLLIRTSDFVNDPSTCSNSIILHVVSSSTQKVYYADFKLKLEQEDLVQVGDDYTASLAISDDNFSTHEVAVVETNQVNSIDTYNSDLIALDIRDEASINVDKRYGETNANKTNIHVEQGAYGVDYNILINSRKYYKTDWTYTNSTFIRPVKNIYGLLVTDKPAVLADCDSGGTMSIERNIFSLAFVAVFPNVTLRYVIDLKLDDDESASTADFNITMNGLVGATVEGTNTITATVTKSWQRFTVDIVTTAGINDFEIIIENTESANVLLNLDKEQLYVANETTSNAMLFSTTALQVVHNADWNITGNITLEAWINAGGAGRRTIIQKSSSADTNTTFGLAIASGTNQLTFIHTSSISTQFILSTNPIPLNTNIHVCAVKNGTNVTLYVNGVVAGSGTLNSATSVTNTTNVFIGARQVPDSYLAGTISQLRVWNVARTGAQIASNFNRELSTGMFANYRMSNPEEGLVNDYSGNNRHFAIPGASGSNYINTIPNFTIFKETLRTLGRYTEEQYGFTHAIRNTLRLITNKDILVQSPYAPTLSASHPMPFIADSDTTIKNKLGELLHNGVIGLFYDGQKYRIVNASEGIGILIDRTTLQLVAKDADHVVTENMIIKFARRQNSYNVYRSIITSISSKVYNKDIEILNRNYDYDKQIDAGTNRVFEYADFKTFLDSAELANRQYEYAFAFINTLNPPTPPSGAFTNANINFLDKQQNSTGIRVRFGNATGATRWLFQTIVNGDTLDTVNKTEQNIRSFVLNVISENEANRYSSDGKSTSLPTIERLEYPPSTRNLEYTVTGPNTDNAITAVGPFLNSYNYYTFMLYINRSVDIYVLEIPYLDNVNIFDIVTFYDDRGRKRKGTITAKKVKQNVGWTIELEITATDQVFTSLTI